MNDLVAMTQAELVLEKPTSLPLPAVAAETVQALAAVTVPLTNTADGKAGDAGSDKGSDKRDGGKLSKWAGKKKKLPCYRCGEPGHFAVVCTTELCDYCSRSQHTTGECPLLSGPKLMVNIYGVCCEELMFFESPDVAPVTHIQESSYPAVVKVTSGTLTEAHIV